MPKSNKEKSQDLPSSQFRALFIKHATFQWRQKKTNAFQILVPVAIVLLVGVTQILFDTFINLEFPSNQPIPADPKQISFSQLSSQSLSYFTVPLPETSPHNQNSSVGYLTNTSSDGLLGKIPQRVYDGLEIPTFQWMNNVTDIDNSIYATKSYYMHSLGSTSCNGCPEAALIVNNLSKDDYSFNYTVMADAQLNSDFAATINTMVNMFNLAFINTVHNHHTNLNTTVQNLPIIAKPPNIDIATICATLLFPFAATFLMPVFMYSIVHEKQERLREMMRMMGMKMEYYWLTTYIFDLFLYVIVILVLITVSLGFGIRIFTQTNFLLVFIIFFGWGLSQVSLAIFLSAFCNKTRPATVFGYFLVIALVICSNVLNVIEFATSAPPLPYLFIPPLAFYRAIYLMGSNCALLQCLGWSSLTSNSEIQTIIICLYLEAPTYLIAGWYLDAVLPRENGVVESPLFIVDQFKKILLGWNRSLKKIKIEASPITSENTAPFSQSGEELAEVQENRDEENNPFNEKQRFLSAEGIQRPENYPLILRDLKKIYTGGCFGKGDKLALDQVSLLLYNNECFGLLGPNGAGKTTMLSILTGLYPQTSGDAWICGYDITTSMDSIRKIMSVCPQFDTFWGCLTAREILLFYARLKGVSRSCEQDHVNETLVEVGLMSVGDRLAQNLSGGMMRRLSIGIALVGNPKILFLDEPTTGLDPETKRSIWEVLLRVKKGKCVVLTTHSMEEADVLCDRIGIMSLGDMKCIGTPLYLKKKYGSGYSLHVNYHRHKEADVKRDIQLILRDAMLIENFPGYCAYQMPSEMPISISELFRYLESFKEEMGIIDWGINQTSLEDVFLNVAVTDADDINE